VLPVVRALQASGTTTVRAIAEALNARGIRTDAPGQQSQCDAEARVAPEAQKTPLSWLFAMLALTPRRGGGGQLARCRDPTLIAELADMSLEQRHIAAIAQAFSISLAAEGLKHGVLSAGLMMPSTST
jgi:hypothetical protein